MPKGSTRRTYLPGERPAGEVDETPNEVKYASWPPPRRPAPTMAKTFIPLAAKHGGVTVAHVMAATGCPSREAIVFLSTLQRTGRALRFGGEPGKALVWCLPRTER